MEDRPKPERQRDMTPGFARQRRNLLVCSLVVIVYHAEVVKITAVSLFGNTAAIENPFAVTIGLWILFGYFLFRFHIYLSEEPDSRFAIDYHFLVDDAISSTLSRLATTQNNQGYDDATLAALIDTREFRPTMYGFSKLPWLRAEVRGLRGSGKVNKELDSKTITAKYFRPRFAWSKVHALWKLAYADSRFSDYYLPYAVAGVATIVALGSLAPVAIGVGAEVVAKLRPIFPNP